MMISSEEQGMRLDELEAIRQRAELVALINTALVQAADEQELLVAVTPLALQYRVTLTSLALVTESDSQGKPVALRVAGYLTGDGQVLPADSFGQSEFSAQEYPLIDALFSETEPLFVIEDATTDPRIQQAESIRQFLQLMQVAATIVMPFKSGCQWQGILTFNWPEPKTITQDLLDTLMLISPTLTAVVTNRNLTRNLEKTVEQRTAELRRSEERSRLVVENISDGITIVDTSMCYSYVSPACTRILGFAPEEMVGRSAGELLHPDDLQRVMTEGATSHNVDHYTPAVRMLRKDGTYVWVEATLRAMTDPQSGEITGYISMIRDISERRQAEEALRRSQQMLQTILDNIPARVFWKDRDLNYLGCNRLFAADAGLESPEQIIGKNDFELGWKDQAEAYRADDRSVIEAGVPRLNYEEPQTTPNGGQIWLQTSKLPLYDASGDSIGVLGLYADITERKQAEAERERLQQQVIDAQRQALQELSTPIIPIMDGIIVMPLVGAIDSMRSRDVMRSLLTGINEYRARIAIIDITGVPVVDSGVADHLNRTIQAARLKGTQTIITGITDAVAETIVDLGIDWSNIETLRNLQAGLLMALERVGVRLQNHKSHESGNSQGKTSANRG